MSRTTQAAPYSKELKRLEKQLDKVEAGSEGGEEEGREEDLDKKLVSTLKEACDLVRRVEDADSANLAYVVGKVEGLLDRGINLAYGTDLSIDFLASFAHTESTLIEDPLRQIFGGGIMEDFLAHFASYLGAVGAKRFERTGPGPWKKPLQPKMATLASRFRRNVEIPPVDTHPLARNVFEARCEIMDNEIPSPIRLCLSSSGSCLAMTGAGGWKNRDPVMAVWRFDPDADSEDFDCKGLETGLGDIAYHSALDDARNLIVAADDERIKTYNWRTRKGVHTMKSSRYGGPIVVMPNGRVVRSGKGCAAVWNLDDLETHGDGRKKIGKGKYKLSEDSWRDEDTDNVEPSTGSVSHATIQYADKEYKPGHWHLHQPTSRILSNENPERNRGQGVYKYSCFLLDIERGEKVSPFIGHGGDVMEFSTSAGDANAFATAASDGFARLYDVRHPLPQLTVDVEHRGASCDAVAFAHLDGIPVLFTGGNRTECIKFWDLRAKKTIYELATGNNTVTSMKWDSDHQTLYAATTSMYMDRLGGFHDYRRFRRPDFKHGANRNSEESLNMRASVPETDLMNDEEMEVDDDEEGGEEEEEEDEEADGGDIDSDNDYDECRKWPKRAHHGENYFGCAFDARGHQLYRYQFKESPDRTIWPSPW